MGLVVRFCTHYKAIGATMYKSIKAQIKSKLDPWEKSELFNQIAAAVNSGNITSNQGNKLANRVARAELDWNSLDWAIEQTSC